jgi:transcription elongation factor Elf1
MEIDTEYTDFITCPYCGYVECDSWDIDFDNGECTEIECGICGKEMFVERTMSINYTTRKIINEKE